MHYTKKNIFVIFFIFLLSVITFGQDDDLTTQKILWQTRADTLDDKLLKESSKIPTLEQSLLFAKIGDLWRESDSNKANDWFEKSVDTIFFYSPDNSESAKKGYYETIRSVLSIISNHNQKQADRLIRLLANPNKNSGEEKEQNADALIKYAIQIVKQNPAEATQIGIIALQMGNAEGFYELIWELRRYDAKFADQLFNAAFSAAKISRNYYMLQGIQLAVLPESIVPSFPVKLSASNQQKN